MSLAAITISVLLTSCKIYDPHFDTPIPDRYNQSDDSREAYYGIIFFKLSNINRLVHDSADAVLRTTGMSNAEWDSYFERVGRNWLSEDAHYHRWEHYHRLVLIRLFDSLPVDYQERAIKLLEEKIPEFVPEFRAREKKRLIQLIMSACLQ